MSLLEDAEGVGVGEHQRGHVFVHLRCERGQIDHAAGVGLEVFDLVSGDGGGGGIGAVGGIRDQDLLARVALARE